MSTKPSGPSRRASNADGEPTEPDFPYCPKCNIEYDPGMQFKTPRFFACGHTVCTGCVVFADAGEEEALILCPLCERSTRKAVPGAEECLPVDVAMSELVTRLRGDPFELARMQLCKQCDRRLADKWCMECAVPLCGECAKRLHKDLTKLAEHDRVPYSRRPHYEKCEDHDRILALFDARDERLCCDHCRDFGTSLGHDCPPLGDVAPEKRDELRGSWHAGNGYEATLRVAEKGVGVSIEDLRRNAASTREEIATHFAGLKEQLLQRERDLISAVNKIEADRVTVFQEQRMEQVGRRVAGREGGEAGRRRGKGYMGGKRDEEKREAG
jgi:hypothetical protein